MVRGSGQLAGSLSWDPKGLVKEDAGGVSPGERRQCNQSSGSKTGPVWLEEPREVRRGCRAKGGGYGRVESSDPGEDPIMPCKSAKKLGLDPLNNREPSKGFKRDIPFPLAPVFSCACEAPPHPSLVCSSLTTVE